jgi:hypothetical protein
MKTINANFSSANWLLRADQSLCHVVQRWAALHGYPFCAVRDACLADGGRPERQNAKIARWYDRDVPRSPVAKDVPELLRTPVGALIPGVTDFNHIKSQLAAGGVQLATATASFKGHPARDRICAEAIMKNDCRFDVRMRRLGRHLSAWALLAASCSVYGGGEVVGQPIQPAVRPESASVSEKDVARALARPDSKTRALRCWHALLIVERRVDNMPDDATSVVRIGAGDKPEAQLFDLRPVQSERGCYQMIGVILPSSHFYET